MEDLYGRSKEYVTRAWRRCPDRARGVLLKAGVAAAFIGGLALYNAVAQPYDASAPAATELRVDRPASPWAGSSVDTVATDLNHERE